MKFFKHQILIVMVGLVVSLPAQQMSGPLVPFTGQWWLGVLEEASLPVNLTFCVDGGELKPVLYSPMQTKDPMPATTWSFANDTLNISHKSSGLRLTLVWNPSDSSFDGTFRQGMLRTTMHFVPTDTLFSIVRPQTPHPPFPYTEHEVVIERKRAKVRLAGTLTIPEGEGPFPAVVLVSGSGQQNRDEELLGHKPFLVLSDYLSRNGIAVLRCDDRGVGGSTGDVEKATTLDFADDAEAVFDFLRKQKKIDRRRVGIIGHSEGGLIAPIVASRNSKVAYIVLLAGPGSTGADILLQQTERILQLEGVAQPLIERRLAMLRELYATIDTVPVKRYESYIADLFVRHTEGLDKEQCKVIGMRKGDAIAMSTELRIPWMRTFIRLDNREYLSKVQCPILAVNGEKDCQVLPQNLDTIKQVAGKRVDTRKIEGLNHLMQHCTMGSSKEYMLIEETMSREVLEMIVEWIEKEER